MKRRVAALVLFALMLVTPARAALESSMSLQMLVQVPLFALCGAVVGGAFPPRWRERLDRWNAYGMAGLFAVALVTALLMIPRALDLAVADWRIDAVKALALLACGIALRASWTRAGALVQGFFLGNVLPMTAAVGQLYQDSPLRLCNAYLLGDQVRLGQALVGVAAAVGMAWFGRLAVILMRREAAGLPPRGSTG
ncbi:MAG TPA: hypothetical protein VKD22_16030 [Ramlibacter sp.]|nr:hypothetical protein [Ramlibacter sp.]